ncbi:hypothetical protein ACFL6U_07980 [Planctomycetota bacterium]
MESSGDNPAVAAALSLYPQNAAALTGLREWENVYGPGLELQTSHYRIFTTLMDPAILSRLPLFMECSHAAYNRLLPEPVEPQTRSTVYLFASRRQWEAFTQAYAGEQAPVLCKIRQGAYCHQGACVAYDIGVDRTMAALSHEGWHQFMTRHFAYRLPSWLDEGIAMLFETFTWDDDQCRFRNVANLYRVGGLKAHLDSGTMLSLEQLLMSSPGEIMAQDNSQSVMGFYSQAYALVCFLHIGENGAYRAAFQRLLIDGLHAYWPLDPACRKTAADRNCPRTLTWNRKVGKFLFRHYISDDLVAVEKQYLAFCREMVKSLDLDEG